MLKSKRASFLRGRALRVTKLDRAGRPVLGDESVVVSKGYVTISYTANTEEGEAITVTNAAGETCVSETAVPSFNGYTMEVTFCDVDFALFSMLTGQEVIDDGNGTAVGYKMESGVDVSAEPFALEVWLGAQTDMAPSTASEGFFGYVLTPFLNGGTVGDFTVENAAITFTVNNLSTKTGSAWGAGPHLVQLNAAGTTKTTLLNPVSAKEHLRQQIVEVAPPEPYVGARPLLDSTDPEVTSITATETGLSVSIAPTPAGSDPMWYDLGDGTWDYAATGSYTHEYAAAGTYTIIGYRGGSSASTTVTVSA